MIHKTDNLLCSFEIHNPMKNEISPIQKLFKLQLCTNLPSIRPLLPQNSLITKTPKPHKMTHLLPNFPKGNTVRIRTDEQNLWDKKGIIINQNNQHDCRVIPCKNRKNIPTTPSDIFEIYAIHAYHWEEKNCKSSAQNSTSFKSYDILKCEQKCLISSLHLPLSVTLLYLFLNFSDSTKVKYLKSGTWLFLRVLNSNLKRNWPASNILLIIFLFSNC